MSAKLRVFLYYATQAAHSSYIHKTLKP